MNAIDVTDDVITIQLDFFVYKDFSVSGRELIIDILAKNYKNQKVVFVAYDGENLEFSGYLQFIEYLKQAFNIQSVKIESHNKIDIPGIECELLRPGIFLSAGKIIPEITNTDITDAKFVGLTLGRLNPVRLRLAYEIDNAFPQDSFLILHPKLHAIEHNYRNVRHLYDKEFEWLTTKNFDTDLQSRYDNGMIMWQESAPAYTGIWNKFKIEIISETDAHSSHWITEKTARCLATGKPFVLMSGQNSLKYLQELGFNTFSEVLDESYDSAIHPNQRIELIINSLKQLKSDDFSAKMKRLTEIAISNIQIYKDFTNK